MSELWQKIFHSYDHIPTDIGTHLQSTHEVFPFRLALNGLEFPKAFPSSEFRFRLSFFDFSITSFFGKPWISPWVRSNSDKVDINQLVFFIVPFKGPNNTVLALEILEKQQGKIEGTNYRQASQRVKSLKLLISQCQFFRSDLFLGSIKSLLYLKEFPQASSKISKLNGGRLVYNLTPHKPLLKVINWLPENAVVDGKESIPGLLQPENGLTLENPSPLATVPAFIDNLTVTFGNLGENFEANLCAMLNRERFSAENRPADGTTLLVTERRLHIGVHNGLTYIHEPLVAQLHSHEGSETGSVSRRRSKVHKRTSSLDMKNPQSKTGLKLSNRVEISDLAEDPGLAIVLVLEYVLGVQNMPALANKEVLVGWSVWSPFAQDSTSKKAIELPLNSGPIRNPLEALMFKDGRPPIVGSQPKTFQNLSAVIRFDMQISEAPLHYQNQNQMNGTLSFPSLPQFQLESMERSMRGSFAPQSAHEFPISPTSAESRSEPDTNQTASPVPPPRAGRAPLAKVVTGTPNQLVPYQNFAASQSMLTSPNMAMNQFGSYFPFAAHNSMAQYSFMNSANFAQSLMVPDMREVPANSNQVPILALQQQNLSSLSVSRGAFAIFKAAEFQPILDYKSEEPDLIEPNDRMGYSLHAEMSDQFKCSEIIVQFLALGRSKPQELLPQSVFFTFQFYRFPQINTEKLLVSNRKGDASLLPCILRRLDKSGALLSSSPGYQVRFVVDPQSLTVDEHQLFLRYLYEGHLNVDVWDSESLILLGSCLIPLKVLLRSGKPAVQSYLELPVVSTDFQEENDEQDERSEIGVVIQSRLFVKVANVGYPVSLSDSDLMSQNTSVVTQKLSRMGKRRSNSGSRYVVKAETLTSKDANLRENLHSLKHRPSSMDSECTEMDEQKKRKLERMRNLRKIEDISNFKSDKSSRVELVEDIQTIKSARNRRKHQSILTALMESLTTYHTIFPSLGSAEFFEFLLRNPFNEPTVLLVEISNPELKLLSNPAEWQFFKQLYNLLTPMDESLVTLDANSLGITLNESTAAVFLKPKENAYIPFKYQSFSALENTQANRIEPAVEGKQSLWLQSQTIKVTFKHANTKEPTALLVLDVEPQPQTIHQVFRFYQAEQTFFVKYIRVAPLIIQSAFASDPHVICEVNQTTGMNPDVYIKAGCGKSPTVKSFSVLLYGDKFLSRPVQMWQVFLHATQRIETSAIQGHVSRFSMLLKGDRASRMIKFSSSSPTEVDFQPNEPFLLQANSSCEVTANLTPSQPGRRTIIVTAVDVELHSLLKSWLVFATVSEPNITKAFQVRLPIGSDLTVNKKITFKNLYAVRKRFVVVSSDERYVSVKDIQFELEPKETGTIHLRFVPQNFRHAQEIFLYINDTEGKTEETYGIKILVDM